MGYTTSFEGKLQLNKQLSLDDYQWLKNFAEERHEEPGYPGIWCQWAPSKDGWHIGWDGGEKFYDYVEWMEYLIKEFFFPKGYRLNGEIEWEGEEQGDVGKIMVVDNKVTVVEGRIAWEATHVKCPHCGEGINLAELESEKKKE